MVIPYVVDKKNGTERSFDIFSRLVDERIIFLGEEVSDPLANSIVAQLLFLEAVDPEKPIKMYINSPGGSVTAGMAILDTMQLIKCPVYTYSLGMSASMASVLLAAGEKGHRYALPHTKVMIHQPSGGMQGKATDMEINMKQLLMTKEQLNRMLAEFSSRTVEEVSRDTERDYYMSAEEARNYGLVDKVLKSQNR